MSDDNPKRSEPELPRGAHLCRFSSLDDVPKRRRGDHMAVGMALLAAGRFSTFEVDGSLAGALRDLERRGWFVFDSKSVGYPWTLALATDAGRAALAAAVKHDRQPGSVTGSPCRREDGIAQTKGSFRMTDEQYLKTAKWTQQPCGAWDSAQPGPTHCDTAEAVEYQTKRDVEEAHRRRLLEPAK